MTPVVAEYPILGQDRLDFELDHAYEVTAHDLATDSDQKIIQHKILGQNLVRELICTNHASFACTVVAPEYAYRRVELPVATCECDANSLSVEQQVQTSTDEYSTPVILQCYVVVTEPVDTICLKADHGVSDLWVNQSISLAKSTKIALGPFLVSQSTLQSILQIRQAEEGLLPKGCFEVEPVQEAGFYFSVSVEKSLFETLKNPREAYEHRDSIYCFALTQGLEILNRDYKEEETWRQHLHLRSLHKMLAAKGAQTWDEEDFKANRAVAHLKPHVIRPFDLVDSMGE